MIYGVNINIADVRAEPKFQSERISQALFNETLEVLEEKDGYMKSKSRDDYIGWIASQFLSEQKDSSSDKIYIVISNLAIGFANPDISSKRIVHLPYGCNLFGEVMDGFMRVSSERYGEIYVSLKDVLPLTKPIEPHWPERDSLIKEAEKFLSVPYLWGGRSFFGIDCSGFVQTIMRRFGWEIPRDTKDQISCGIEIGRESIQAGDLLFFTRHVALAVSESDFIHSSSGNGGVAYNSLDHTRPLYSEYLDKEFKTARRIFK